MHYNSDNGWCKDWSIEDHCIHSGANFLPKGFYSRGWEKSEETSKRKVVQLNTYEIQRSVLDGVLNKDWVEEVDTKQNEEHCSKIREIINSSCWEASYSLGEGRDATSPRKNIVFNAIIKSICFKLIAEECTKNISKEHHKSILPKSLWLESWSYRFYIIVSIDFSSIRVEIWNLRLLSYDLIHNDWVPL